MSSINDPSSMSPMTGEPGSAGFSGGSGNFMGLPGDLAPPGANAIPTTANIHGVPIGGRDASATTSASQTDTISTASDPALTALQSFLTTQESAGTASQLSSTDPNNPQLPLSAVLQNIDQAVLLAGGTPTTMTASAASTQGSAAPTQTTIQQEIAQIVLQAGGSPATAGKINAALKAGGGTQTTMEAVNAALQEAGASPSLMSAVNAALTASGGTSTVSSAINTVASEVSKTHGGNPWLAGNVMVAFLIAFMDIVFSQKASQAAAGQVMLNQISIISTMAQVQADLITSSAELEAIGDFVAAAAAGVSLLISAISLAGTGAAMKSMSSVNREEGLADVPQQPQVKPESEATEDDYMMGPDGPGDDLSPKPLPPEKPDPGEEPPNATAEQKAQHAQAKEEHENNLAEREDITKKNEQRVRARAHNEKATERYQARQAKYDQAMVRAERRNTINNLKIQRWGAITAAGQSLQQFMTNLTQGITVELKAQRDASLKEVDATMKIVEGILDNTRQQFSNAANMIDQATQAYQKMSDSMSQAQQGVLGIKS